MKIVFQLHLNVFGPSLFQGHFMLKIIRGSSRGTTRPGLKQTSSLVRVLVSNVVKAPLSQIIIGAVVLIYFDYFAVCSKVEE